MQHQDGLTILRAELSNVQAKAGRKAMLREPQITGHGSTLPRGEKPNNGGLMIEPATALDGSIPARRRIVA
jgi:hypothetical protein